METINFVRTNEDSNEKYALFDFHQFLVRDIPSIPINAIEHRSLENIVFVDKNDTKYR